MFDTFTRFALPFAFSLFVACALAALVSGVYLVFFKLRQTNMMLQHPFLKHQAFERYPIPIRSAILLDYFFRLAFPKSQFWLIGNANRLLSHIEPKEIPTAIKWPLMGLWGGCFVGILAMVVVWILIFIRM